MSILLQLKNAATALAGPLFRTAIMADMTAIENEVNNLDVVVSGLTANVTTTWVSGTNYVIGDHRRSPLNFQTYRRIFADGAGTTDPSLDTTYWAASTALWAMGKNICVNPAFQINQLEYVSGAALASGSYGHDQWKAGSGGGDYSFTQNFASTQITIAANKTLIQAFAPENVNSTSFVVSWTGTAQCRIGVNTSTPAGAYAASPVLITGQTIGGAMSIEFNAGTLGEVMVDEGGIVRAMPEHRYADVLAECQRYLPAFSSESATSFISSAFAYNSTAVLASVVFPERARTAPTGIVISSVSHITALTGTTGDIPSAVSMNTASRHGCLLECSVTSVTSGQGGELYFNSASGRLFFTGCQV